jgi:radical SAM superfamily enzyme YgiQ (UPF0313 family)
VIVIKTVFIALNAKFIHSSLALRSIKKYCAKFNININIAEFTINNSEEFIFSEIYKMKPDVLGFSCYIWNIEMILNIVSVIKKILPNTKIILGGPEVSHEYEYLFQRGADIITIGEGERTSFEIISFLKDKNKNLSDIDGIAYHDEEKIVVTKKRTPLTLDDIPFVYDDFSIEELQNKIIYYETSRGCPYNCQYCLSSIEKGVRFLSKERAFKDLKFFLDKKVKQVKFVDRTFNCNKKFAVEIWEFLIKNDNGITNFHFEISADIIDDDMLNVLKKARKQLFQLEIGVQSTNPQTLSSIQRKTDLTKLLEKVSIIKSFKNIHQHLDLIAGLPFEDYDSFKKSFDDVYTVYPEQIQLGFLKLLRGSGLRKNSEKYGIVYNEKPPYEVLFTGKINFGKMTFLKYIAEMVEIYYNSGKCLNTVKFMVNLFDRPFSFFEKLALYWIERDYHEVSHNKMRLYTIMFEFCLSHTKDLDKLKNILKFDMYLNDNIKNFPYWLPQNSFDETKSFARKFFENTDNVKKYIPNLLAFSPKQLSRMCHIEKFDYNVCLGAQNNFSDITKETQYVLFDYYGKNDLLGNCLYYKL